MPKERKSLSNQRKEMLPSLRRCRLQTSTLPLEVRAFRVEVVEDFLKAGVSLHKIDKLRDLLERGGNRLTDSSHLRQHIPLILKQETERLKEEIATRDLGLIFDESTRLGEAIVIIARFVSDNWSIVQRLIRLDICAKSVNAQDLAYVLNDCMSVDNQVRGNSLLSTMKDGASVNHAALNRRVGRGGAMGANASPLPPPPHGPKRSAWKDLKMNLRK